MKVKRKIYIYFDDLDETVQKELLDLFGSVARGMSFVFVPTSAATLRRACLTGNPLPQAVPSPKSSSETA